MRVFQVYRGSALFAILLAGGVATVGCGGGNDDSSVISKVESSGGITGDLSASGKVVVTAGDLAAIDESEASTDPSDPLISVEEKSWEEILAAAKGAGKPVVLDIWSLSCEPCMREFPGLVRLHEEFGEDLVCISANIEYDGRMTHPASSYHTEVMRFLRTQKARTKNFLCATPNEDVYAAVEIDSIPAVLIFDAEGNEVRRFVDAGETLGFTYDDDIIPVVREMMGAGSDGSTVDSEEPAAVVASDEEGGSESSAPPESE